MKGTRIGERFELHALLGRGGMSEVWLAHDAELERHVAIKLHASHADPVRFEREARAAARLAHPNVAKIFDYGDLEGRPYLVLEYLPGGTLEERLAAREPLDDESTERIARDVAAGLAHAHDHGLVHRDLKPSNVLFDSDGNAKIADFGIARADDDTMLTDAGAVLGTAAYISPEQASGQPIRPATDVYSFGVMLFRMLTGQVPFPAQSALQMAVKHRSEPAPTVESIRPDAPAALSLLAASALAKDPGLRPADGNELLAMLADEPPTASLAAAPTEGAPRARRRPIVGVVALGLVALAGVLTGLVVLSKADVAPGTPRAPAEQPAGTKTAADEDQSSAGRTTTTTTSAATTHAGTTAGDTAASTTEPATTATDAATTTAPMTTEEAPTTTAGP